MPDISRRTLLTGLALAPVAVPAAVAFGASNALGNKLPPVIGSVRVAPIAYSRDLADLCGFEVWEESGPTLSEAAPAWIDKLAERMVADFIDNSAEIKRLVADIAQAEGHSPDVLDRDVAAYAVVA